MTTTETPCSCGCSSMTTLTAASEACGCGCECCAEATKSRADEIKELKTLRAAIETRLSELTAGAAGS